jgi:hypothetical protein
MRPRFCLPFPSSRPEREARSGETFFGTKRPIAEDLSQKKGPSTARLRRFGRDDGWF